MRVAILHFHLRAGGVTRVIELAASALVAEGMDVLVISGEAMPDGCRLPKELLQVAPLLRYGVEASEAEVLREQIEAAMRVHWGAEADIIHAHNSALGKNFALPLVVTRWAEEGRALLLQEHDFAENGRPANYDNLLAQLGGQAGLDRCLYPLGSRVCHAVLNEADRRRFLAAGMESCHLLPNPALLAAGGEVVSREELQAERAIVYPTRAIRRKNVGETLLWALGAEKGERYFITGAPTGPVDIERHEGWMALAKALELPVVFDAQRALGRSSVDFFLSADLCVTTSVGEGFGMAFLEPWLADCAVAGRNLSYVTDDFKASGVKLDDLYERVDLPVGIVGEDVIVADIDRQIRAACAAYRVPYEERFLAQARAAVIRDGLVDFGRVTEERQRALLIHLRSSGQRLRLPSSDKQVAENRALIEREYSLKQYGVLLRALYSGALEAEAGPVAHLDTRRMLLACFGFEDFFALRG